MTLACSKFCSNQKDLKTKYKGRPKCVFYETFKHQLSYTFYEARRLFAITYVLEIHMYVFRPHPGEIVKISQDKFKIFDLSRISAFIKYNYFYGVFLYIDQDIDQSLHESHT